MKANQEKKVQLVNQVTLEDLVKMEEVTVKVKEATEDNLVLNPETASKKKANQKKE